MSGPRLVRLWPSNAELRTCLWPTMVDGEMVSVDDIMCCPKFADIKAAAVKEWQHRQKAAIVAFNAEQDRQEAAERARCARAEQWAREDREAEELRRARYADAQARRTRGQ